MKRSLLLLIFISACFSLPGQQDEGFITGRVSFISSANVYVRFNSTIGISAGDTLFIPSGKTVTAALVVRNLSSTSCLCLPLSGIDLTTDDLVIAKKKAAEIVIPEKEKEKTEVVLPVNAQSADTSAETRASVRKQLIKGTVSVNSYSEIAGSSVNNSQRFRYSLSLNVRNIAGSGFSFDSYVSFRHSAGDWMAVKDNIFSALKIYSLSAGYDLDNKTHFSIGRRTNPKISNIGPTDGIQAERTAERTAGKFTFGLVAGSRPDFSDYGFNLNLFQYGGYVSLNTKTGRGFSGTSVAVMQQTNSGSTDRRFIYFQHSGTPFRDLYFLSTFEIDLYKLENDQPKSTFNLTGAYISLRYRSGSRLTLSGTYDARKNVMYYESYRTYLDRILEEGTRQGFRFEAGYRFTDMILLGIRSGYRFMKDDPDHSQNAGAYLTLTRVPGLNMSATLTGTYLGSSFMNGYTAGISLTGNYLKGKLQAGAGYHYTDYTLPESSIEVIQHITMAELSFILIKNLSLAAYYEGTFESRDSYNRLYMQLRLRF
ncbi:MAG: hypothetical protein MUE74_04095 [Bacteroidales bacterium]|nr:hypothetical protein [Bacteroidales bacterium]